MRALWPVAVVILMAGCSKKGPGPIYTQEQRRAIEGAHRLYDARKASGKSMSRGPCLGEIMPGWVADVVHNPRQPIDEDPDNQCRDYLKGKAKHFVELDLEGNVVRVK